MSMSDVTAVILAGGRSTRMGGGDKTQSLIGTHTSLDLLVGSLPRKVAVVVVGPHAPTVGEAVLCREDPEFGGPVAALAAGLQHVTTPYAFVVAADMPRAGGLLERLHTARANAQAESAIPVDADDHVQHLCFLARTSALSEAIEGLATPVDAAMKSVFAQIDVYTVQLTPQEEALLEDFNTPEELEALRSHLG